MEQVFKTKRARRWRAPAGWGNRICVDGIRKVSYNPNAIGMQKVKIEHAQGFVMINPDKPLEFVEALREIDPNLSVEGFEQIKTN